jgi:hypothetical protein
MRKTQRRGPAGNFLDTCGDRRSASEFLGHVGLVYGALKVAKNHVNAIFFRFGRGRNDRPVVKVRSVQPAELGS